MQTNTVADSSSIHPAYRPDIDGLRAIAVLSVVAYHVSPALLASGFIGVDIFFVISGYLISSIIIKGATRDAFSFRDFYSRRIKRIAPALLVVLVCCLIFGWFGLLADEFQQLGKHVAAGMGFVSNLVLWSESGYFDSASEAKPLLHLWSLGIEEQFYIFWPILILFFHKRKVGLSGALVGLLLASFVFNILWIERDAVATFYSPLTRGWELLAGALLAYMTLKGRYVPSRTGRHATLVAWLGVLILGAGFLGITDEKLFPGFWALLPVLGAAFLIGAGPLAWPNRVVLSNPLLVWFGLISYPLYLWHWPLLSLSATAYGGTPPLWFRAFAMVVAVVLAWCTYQFLEKPVRRGSTKWLGARYLLAMMVIVAIAGMLIFLNQGFKDRQAVRNSDFTEEVRAQFMGAQWKYTINDECTVSFPFKEAENYRWWFCMKSGPDDPSIAILGNSYANQLYPGFVQNPFLSQHTVLSIGTCDGAQEVSYGEDGANPCYGERRTEQTEFINQLVLANESIQYIMLDGLTAEPDEAYIQRLIDRIALFEEAGRQVIVFTPHLRPSQDPKSCFSTPLRAQPKDCSIPLDNRVGVDTGFQPLIDAVRLSQPDVLFFDQNDVFCNEEGCSGVLDGMPMHRDNRHTSEYASILLQDYFTEWARTNLPELLDK